MALQKLYNVKVYDNTGVNFVKTFNTDRPEGADTDYLKEPPTFRSTINSGQGELVLDLALPFDDFDEGVSVRCMNIVRVYAVTIDTDTLTQTETLIYSGFMSKYDAYTQPGGAEGIRVTCLGLASLLAMSYYKSGSSFEVTHTSEDPSEIAEAILDHFDTVYPDLISYSGSTIDTVGSTVSITFTDQRWSDALQKAATATDTSWWWFVDQSGLFYLKEKPAAATHTFTIGKDIDEIVAPKTSETVVNDLQVRRDGGTTSDYSDATSQTSFGKRTKIINDSSLTNSGAADQVGNKEISDNKDQKVKATVTVNKNYPIETVQVGHTCQILNFNGASTFFSDNMLIVALDYRGDENGGDISIELEEMPNDFGTELRGLISSTSPTSSSSSGGGGGGGDSPAFVDRETPTGSINDSNTAFTLSQTPVVGSEMVYLDGILQNGGGNDYTATGTSLSFASAPASGSVLLVSYRTSSGSTSFADREVPTGSIDDSNAIFTLAHTPTTGSEMVYLDGILQNGSGNDYSISSATITFVSAPASGSVLLASYRY